VSETIVQNYEPTTKVIETWWVQDNSGDHPTGFGADEQTCREYQQVNGGDLQIIRVWETRIMQIVKVADDPT